MQLALQFALGLKLTPGLRALRLPLRTSLWQSEERKIIPGLAGGFAFLEPGCGSRYLRGERSRHSDDRQQPLQTGFSADFLHTPVPTFHPARPAAFEQARTSTGALTREP